MKRRIIILILFVIMSLFLYKLTTGIVWYNEDALLEVENEHNRAVVKYKDAFIYAPHRVKILYGSKSSWFFIKHKTIRATIANKGMSLNQSNCKYEWIDENTLIIKLRGKIGMYDSTHTIHFDKQ